MNKQYNHLYKKGIGHVFNAQRPIKVPWKLGAFICNARLFAVKAFVYAGFRVSL